MASTITYLPSCHCYICINLGRQVTCTKQVVKGDRVYRTCDEHEQVVAEAATAADAMRQVRTDTQKTGG